MLKKLFTQVTEVKLSRCRLDLTKIASVLLFIFFFYSTVSPAYAGHGGKKDLEKQSRTAGRMDLSR